MQSNLKPISSYYIPEFDANLIKDCQLSILWAEKQISFYLKLDDKPYGLEVFASSLLADCWNSWTHKSQNFQSIDIVLDMPNISLIPSEYFHESKVEQWAQQAFQMEGMKAHFEKVGNKFLLFSAPKQELPEPLKFASYKHIASKLLVQNGDKAQSGEEMFLEIRDSYFVATLYRDKKLLLHNVYSFHAKADFGFFALGIVHQLKFDPRGMRLYLSGLMQLDSPLQILLKDYIQNVEWVEPNISSEFQSVSVL